MDSIANFYNNLAERYGTGFQSADAQSEESLVARYKVLSEVGGLNGLDVLEVGCGTGGLGVYLKNKYPSIRYTGIDIAGKAIEVGRIKYPELNLIWTDVLTYDPVDISQGIVKRYDCVLAQGVFYKLPDSEEGRGTVLTMLKLMMRLSKRMVAFTALDTWGKRQGNELRIDPVFMLNFLKDYTTNVVFRHEYGYDSCFYAYKGE